MLKIDGSFGEGGGQIVRSTLALAMVTTTPVTIDRIRAGRDKPGLQRQHLTAVCAAAEICGARIRGHEVGSLRLDFSPKEVRAGQYHFRVGTAGSTTLVLQTILPALLRADGVSTVTLEGGTHNPMAPPFDFLSKAYLPVLQRMGMVVRASLVRPGFYPAGGGMLTVSVQPTRELKRLELMDRGLLIGGRVRAMVSKLPLHIGQRECQTIAQASGWDEQNFAVEQIADSPGPGNVVLIELEFDQLTEVFVGFGQRGVPAEKVALRVWAMAKDYLDAGVPVGPYLADQLILPLAVGALFGSGGGSFRTCALSRHCTTHIELVKRILNLDIEVTQENRDDYVVRVGSPVPGTNAKPSW